MLIEIHVIQNHPPSNLNRDDLGAPKTCYFGGVLRSRISSQCIKRSIRMSDEFKALLGGVATRRLGQLIAGDGFDLSKFEKAMRVLKICGIAPKEKKGGSDNDSLKDEDKSAGRVYTTHKAVHEMSMLLRNEEKSDQQLAVEFAKLIVEHTAAPDMALCGRMLEPKKTKKAKKGKSDDADEIKDEESGEKPKDKGVWKGMDLNVTAALQVAHALSTHEARPEVDYYVASDDVPGDDAGAAFVDEAMFASACFYKYFSIHWETLVKNLKGDEELAAHTVGAFIRGAMLANPTGKQNSYAAHNPPDGVAVEIKEMPISYANAFASPVKTDTRDIVSQSIAQLAQYMRDLDVGYGKPNHRFWFSPNLHHALTVIEEKVEMPLASENLKSLDELVVKTISALGFDWAEVQKKVINAEAVS
ncbi:MAG: type I-E CRISPR-associated protein Cas7/Cse4/CasC [Candidatus Sumerlaeota bacterium]|nr:type I-E CRISPR-associated protein Cas7/Cse4/CasC [Candidatus Sumerlaeota bacterium]